MVEQVQEAHRALGTFADVQANTILPHYIDAPAQELLMGDLDSYRNERSNWRPMWEQHVLHEMERQPERRVALLMASARFDALVTEYLDRARRAKG